jgi:hypothetical protein
MAGYRILECKSKVSHLLENFVLSVEQNCNIEYGPLCGSALIDDCWDIMEDTKDGGFILDVFEAWVCERKCGFYIRKK